MNKPLRIGIAGLGTVGCGAINILHNNAELITNRCGRAIEIVAVTAGNKNKKRDADISGLKWVDSALDMVADTSIDVVVEAIGGSEGIARELVEKSLTAGRSVVTANKALIAHHGIGLAKLAEQHNAMLAFEAAVAGGIPVIKALRDGLAANRFTHIAGIINGTCNYILSRMRGEGLDLPVVMEEAGKLGYLEADPSFDVDGIDAAHKLSILTSLAFGCAPAIDKVYMEGIRGVSKHDIQFAEELGYVVKLLGIASVSDEGILQRVHPALVPISSSLANVNGSFNAIQIEGDAVGTVFLEGRGAGAGPTGSSVVADVMDIARGVAYKPFTLPVASLKAPKFASMENLKCSYYLRLSVIDKPGVLADVTSIFRDAQISMRSVIQHSHNPGEVVQIVITTHETQESSMQKAMDALAKLGSVKEKPYRIRIESV
ncbi:MAG: homoserine dehydrogenase [Alphaproteobacteria bacterium]